MVLVRGIGTGGTTTLATANALRLDQGLRALGVDLDEEFAELDREVPVSTAHRARGNETTQRLFAVFEEMGLEPLDAEDRRLLRNACGAAGASWGARTERNGTAGRSSTPLKKKGARLVSGATATKPIPVPARCQPSNPPPLTMTFAAAISPSTPWQSVWTATISANCSIRSTVKMTLKIKPSVSCILNSFIDDPTRIFRAVRYEQRYSFILDPSSFILVNPKSLAVLQTLSGERIRHELDLIFEEDNAYQMILRLGDLGLFKWIHPEIPAFNNNYSDFLEMDTSLDIPANRTIMGYMLWLMDLSEAVILFIARRLDFTSDLTHSVWAASQLKKSLPFLVGSKPSIWTFALENLPLLSIYAVYLVCGENALLDYLSLWRHIKSRATGDDLKARGLEPGRVTAKSSPRSAPPGWTGRCIVKKRRKRC